MMVNMAIPIIFLFFIIIVTIAVISVKIIHKPKTKLRQDYIDYLKKIEKWHQEGHISEETYLKLKADYEFKLAHAPLKKKANWAARLGLVAIVVVVIVLVLIFVFFIATMTTPQLTPPPSTQLTLSL
jgi:uncharacterized integral membrane protein